jgi:hypothetical protein
LVHKSTKRARSSTSPPTRRRSWASRQFPQKLAHLLPGDMATLLRSLIFIKPIREGHAFFMIHFNAVNRPETGHTHSSGPCSVTVPDPSAFLCCLLAKSYGPRRARHGALLHLRNGCGTRRWSGNPSRLIHSNIHSQACLHGSSAACSHDSGVPGCQPPPPNIIANMKSRLGKGGQKEGASAGSSPNPQL